MDPGADKTTVANNIVDDIAVTFALTIFGAGAFSTNSEDKIRIEDIDDDEGGEDPDPEDDDCEQTEFAQGAMKNDPSGISHDDAAGDDVGCSQMRLNTSLGQSTHKAGTFEQP